MIYIDHKPLTYAFNQKLDKCSPRQFNNLDFISQLTTDIRHICCQDNVIADALYRVEAVCRPFTQKIWLKRRQTMQNSPPFCTEPPPSGWRSFRLPARTLLYIATHLQRDNSRTFPQTSGGMCSTLSTVLATLEQE